jgi:hypothetical protein
VKFLISIEAKEKCDGIINDIFWEQVEMKHLLTEECHLLGFGAV